MEGTASCAATILVAGMLLSWAHSSTAPLQHKQLIFMADHVNPYGFPGQWELLETNRSGAGPPNDTVEVFSSNSSVVRPAFQKLQCRDRARDLHSLRPYITNSFREAEFRQRRCGRRALTCGRVVLDDVLEREVLEEAVEYKGQLQHWEGLEVVKGLMRKYFKTGPLEPTGGQLDHNIRSELPCELHVDYLSRPPHYFLTAIIYLVDQGKDCDPCETVFVDSAESGLFSQGTVVQPKRGRVVLFSGGMENMHCKVPSAGTRQVVQLWFACSDASTGSEL